MLAGLRLPEIVVGVDLGDDVALSAALLLSVDLGRQLVLIGALIKLMNPA